MFTTDQPVTRIDLIDDIGSRYLPASVLHRAAGWPCSRVRPGELRWGEAESPKQCEEARRAGRHAGPICIYIYINKINIFKSYMFMSKIINK